VGEQQPASIVLDPEVKAQFAADAEYIRANVGDARAHILNTGNRLIAVRENMPYGQWLPWLKAEFNWGEQTARNYMNVARAVAKNPSLGDLTDLSITGEALYVLTGPSAPPGALEQVVDQARSGEHIGLDQAKNIMNAHEQPAAGGQADADPSGAETNRPQPDADSSEDEPAQDPAPASALSKVSPRTHVLTPRKRCTQRQEALATAAFELERAADKLDNKRDKRYLADQLDPTIERLHKLQARLRSTGSE
jgi:hypothetical protein